jgi:hypothetical protein
VAEDKASTTQQVAVNEHGKTVPVKPVITYSFSTQIVGQNNVVTQLHVPIDMQEQEINKILDKVTNTIFRQALKHEIRGLERVVEGALKEVEINERFLGDAEMMFKDVESHHKQEWLNSGKKGPFDHRKLPAQTSAERKQVVINVKASREKLDLSKRLYKTTQDQIAYLQEQLKDGVASKPVSDTGYSNRKRS